MTDNRVQPGQDAAERRPELEPLVGDLLGDRPVRGRLARRLGDQHRRRGGHRRADGAAPRAPHGDRRGRDRWTAEVSDLLRPQFTRYGEVWAIGRGRGPSSRSGCSPADKLIEVDAPLLDKGGEITAFKISPDGARMALVRKTATGSELGLTRLIRASTDQVDGWRPIDLTQTEDHPGRADHRPRLAGRQRAAAARVARRNGATQELGPGHRRRLADHGRGPASRATGTPAR